MASKTRFAGYPSAVAYERADGKKPLQHLLWGSFIRDKGGRSGNYQVKDIHGDSVKGQYAQCHIRGFKDNVFIREHEIQSERLLEVIFVDIGQGDGCLVVTPDDKQMIIDAGQEDNMYRFLRWRFGRFNKKFKFHAGIMSHPDADHYKGFERFFDEPNVSFDTIYTNGIMERFAKSSGDSLGPKKKIGKRSFLTKLVTSKKELEEFLKVKSHWEKKTANNRTVNKQFPTMLKKALDGKKFDNYKMLSIQDAFVPGFGPNDDMTIEVLGPVVEPKDASPPKLRWISGVGKTKNGHSVVLRLKYRNVSMFLGGDLNTPSEDLLLSHHTGLDSPPKNSEDENALIEAARKILQVDIAKSCHHGAADFTPVFLRALNPIATVISSGDNESHSHPRADTLGSIGLHSRGTRPLIFSTELARSTKDSIKHPNVLQRALEADLAAIVESPATTAKEIAARAKKVAAFQKKMDEVIDRSVAVFGAINVVTDGNKVVIAQKLEVKRGNDDKWDIYRLEAAGNGPLRYQSKH